MVQIQPVADETRAVGRACFVRDCRRAVLVLRLADGRLASCGVRIVRRLPGHHVRGTSLQMLVSPG